MANVLARDAQIFVLRLLTEGTSLRSASRLSGVHRTTIQNLLVRFGSGCRELLDERMRNLTLAHVEVDEIWTFCQKKQARLTVDERAERHDIGDIYLWSCVDQDTKLIPTFAIGKRSADMARRLMVDLRSRLKFETPNPHASDAHAFKPEGYPVITQISTDGFTPYPEAVDLAFGQFVRYGQIIKEYRNANMPYTPSEMVGTERRGIIGIDESQERSICTSHVERNNLTIRTHMKRFARLSLGFSKKLENLTAACSLFVANYDFCWRLRHPDHSGKRGRLRATPAMMAKVTDHIWSFEELYSAVVERW